MERGAIHQNTLTRAGRPTRLLAALSLRARRFFLVATLYGPFAQFVHDRRQVHPPGAEHDEKVVENIGRLGANGALVLRRGGDREFDRFFSKFAGAMGRPLFRRLRMSFSSAPYCSCGPSIRPRSDEADRRRSPTESRNSRNWPRPRSVALPRQSRPRPRSARFGHGLAKGVFAQIFAVAAAEELELASRRKRLFSDG